MTEQQRILFFETLEKIVSNDWKIDIYMETPGTAERLREAYLSKVQNLKSEVQLHVGLLHGSFICKEQKHLVITEADIYGYQPKTAHLRRSHLRTVLRDQPDFRAATLMPCSFA